MAIRNTLIRHFKYQFGKLIFVKKNIAIPLQSLLNCGCPIQFKLPYWCNNTYSHW